MSRAGRSLPLLPVGLFLLVLGTAWWSIETAGYLPRFVALTGLLLVALFAVQRAAEIRFLLLQVHARSEPGPTTTLLLAALVLGLAALLAGRTLPTVDLTRERLHSLAPASRTALAAARGPVRLEGFFAQPSPEWDLAQRYLELYRRSSPRVVFGMHDPDREPAAAAAAGVDRPGVIVVSHGGARTQVVSIDEESITQGIARVLEGRPRRVGLLQGHGEPDPTIGGDEGVTAWLQALREANVEPQALSLLESGEVPEGLDAVLLVHPRRPLYPEEVSAVHRFLQRGGRAGLWVEPGDSTGLEVLLRSFYVRLRPGVLRDPGRMSARLGQGPWALALVGDPAHDVTAGLGTFAVAVVARGVEIETPHPPDLTILPLLKTAGPVETLPGVQAGESAPLRRAAEFVAVVLEWQTAVGEGWTASPDAAGLPPVKPLARLLVEGDASPLTNRFLGQGSNRELAVRTVLWLTEQERMLGIRRRATRPAALRLDPAGMRALLYGVEFGLPALLVLAGVAVLMGRRDRGRG